MKTDTQLWAGNQETYEAFVEGLAKSQQDPKFDASTDYTDAVLGRILQVEAGVAVINIAGSLVDGDAGYGIFYGMLGYNDIRTALASAVADPSVSSVLLNVASGGGAVNGCHETSQLIARVDSIKPVVTYTGSTMASAALWLGSQARYTVAAETASVGSLGIIMIHIDRSEELKQAGLKPTIIKAGESKALGNPYEPLSEKGASVLQAKADQLYAVFLEQVALGRGVSAEVADKNFGQGRDFLGKAALAAGLVDSVGSYEAAFAKALSYVKKTPANKSVRSVFGATNSGTVQATASTTAVIVPDNLANSQGIAMSTKSLTAEQLTAMAAGVELATEQTPEELATAAAAELAATALAAETAAAATVKVVEAPAAIDAVAMLQTMLATAGTELVNARTELAAASNSLAALTTQAAGFTEIARASVRTMGIHFGINKEAAEAMSSAEVLSEHGRLAAMFKAKFKVGGVAATTLEKPEAVASAPTMTVREYEIARTLPRAK